MQQMKTSIQLIKVANYDEMSEKAAEIFIQKVKEKPTAILGLATGSTPIGMYQRMITDHQTNGTDYSKVRTFNLDEYVGLAASHDQSYAYFMKQQLFEHINVLSENTHIPSGVAASPQDECYQYDFQIASSGGVDLQVLGIGSNGHIGFNEPGTPFTQDTHVIALTENTRKDNARFFTSLDEVPTHAITSGIATIMRSKQIVLLASGKSKAKAIRHLLQGEITEEVPATALRRHKNVIVIADEEACSLLQ